MEPSSSDTKWISSALNRTNFTQGHQIQSIRLRKHKAKFPQYGLYTNEEF